MMCLMGIQCDPPKLRLGIYNYSPPSIVPCIAFYANIQNLSIQFPVSMLRSIHSYH